MLVLLSALAYQAQSQMTINVDYIPKNQTDYENRVNLPQYFGKCLSCVTPGFNYSYCPTTRKCFDPMTQYIKTETRNKNGDVTSRVFWEYMCPDVEVVNMTDVCLEQPEFNSEVCDEIYYYGSTRDRYLEYNIVRTLEPEKACYFKYNGTRSYIQISYPTTGVLYFAAADVPLFDYTTDVPSQVYFNNSRLFITSAGQILEERNNYVTFLMVNANPDPIDFKIRIY